MKGRGLLIVNDGTLGAMFEGFIVGAWTPIEGHSRLLATA